MIWNRKTLVLLIALAMGGCTSKSGNTFISEKNIKCSVPVANAKAGDGSVIDSPVTLELGFLSQKQKEKWVGKGFPAARLVHQSTVTPFPVKGLVGDQVSVLTTPISGSVCEGSIAVMDARKRVWFILSQGDPNRLVFMAYDPVEKKLVDGHAPQNKIFGLNYNQGKLFYMTAKSPETPTRVFIKDQGKQVPLKEFTLPFWVRLDLAGQQRATVDNSRTFSSSAFRSFFNKLDDFNQFFGLSEAGVYSKPWAYLANLGPQTCIVAKSERAQGEIASSDLLCKRTQKAPASTN